MVAHCNSWEYHWDHHLHRWWTYYVHAEIGKPTVTVIKGVAIGGKERTEEQYSSLLADAGFNLAEVHATPGPVDVVEAAVA